MIFRGLEKSLREIADEVDDDTQAHVLELRTKLEVRTWFLRMSVALNISLIAGLTTAVIARYVLGG